MSEKFRCFGNTPLYADYHDNEWGWPVHDDNKLFEMLILEGAQAGTFMGNCSEKERGVSGRL